MSKHEHIPNAPMSEHYYAWVTRDHSHDIAWLLSDEADIS